MPNYSNFSSDFLGNPRFQGLVQAFTGLSEVTAGSALSLGSQGLADGLGWPIIPHGLDQISTGIQTVVSGVPRDTLSSQLMQKGGVPGHVANFADDTLTMCATMEGAAFVNQTASKLPLMWGRIPPGMGRPITGEYVKDGLYTSKNSASKINLLTKEVSNWLGEARLIKNKAGNPIFISKYSTKRIRFDFNRPYPHNNPHMHVELFDNSTWKGFSQIYPKDIHPY